jgi:arginyl-tRNA synthetase
MKHLYEVYVRINRDTLLDPSDPDSCEDEVKCKVIHKEACDIFRKMENGDVELLKMWMRFRQMSLEYYMRMYQHLNISFDVYCSESQQSDGVIRALDDLSNHQLLHIEDDALMVKLEV